MSEKSKTIPLDFPLGDRTEAEVLALEERFEADPSSLCDDERLALVGLAFSRTRVKLQKIDERRKRKNQDPDGVA